MLKEKEKPMYVYMLNGERMKLSDALRYKGYHPCLWVFFHGSCTHLSDALVGAQDRVDDLAVPNLIHAFPALAQIVTDEIEVYGNRMRVPSTILSFITNRHERGESREDIAAWVER